MYRLATNTSPVFGEAHSVVLGAGDLTIECVNAIARDRVPVQLAEAPEFRRKVEAGAAFVESLLSHEGHVYGVTTGYGDSCGRGVPIDLVEELPLHLSRFHGCGLGQHLNAVHTRAVLAVRLASLSRGVSGVRWVLLERLVDFLNHDLLPLIPEEGSVGASGDLTPLSYVAASLVGERDVMFNGRRCTAAEALAAAGLEAITLRPKEGLAIMNGTAVMTALACDAFSRAEYLTRLTARLTAMASAALGGNEYHFDPRLFAVKPHPGQNEIAAWIRADLGAKDAPTHSERLQDRYSIRCAPHVIGVLRDSLPWLRQFIETEINSANDNPIIDGENRLLLHGGHFYGGHIAFAMDSMKTAVANLADLMDRQMALLVDPHFNNGLSANLSGATGRRAAINHGFKAVQIGMSAWTAEALKLTMPASVFSRSTECHNQDKVSMGTIAARDCLRVLQLTEQVTAAMLLASVQAVRLRLNRGELDYDSLSDGIKQTLDQVEGVFPFLEEDRPLENTLRAVVALIQKRQWQLYNQGTSD